MGKSVLPYSQSVDQVEKIFVEFRRSLTREDKELFDRLFNFARQHTPGGVMLADPDPFRPMVLGMLIEILRRVNHGPCCWEDCLHRRDIV